MSRERGANIEPVVIDRLPAYSSGRRLVGEGVFTIGLRYTMNFLWATFRKKPFTEEWQDIREPAQR